MRDTNISESRRAFLTKFAGPIVVALIFLGLTVWTWRKWPDILVDFGRELYVPWQLTSGKTLYTDIAYFNGPFSPYMNALWFRLFGVSLTTLVVCNLAILAITTAMIYRLLSAACDRLTATVCCSLFLCVFGFAQLAEIGNYNFVTPYSHELTHGVALTTGMILCLWQYSIKQQRIAAVLAGILLGLVFLTKAEVFPGAVCAAVLGMALLYLREPSSRRQTVEATLLIGIFLFLPIALFAGYLAMHMPVAEALRGIVTTWTSPWSSGITSNLFYRRSMGIDEPAARIFIMMKAVAAIALLAGAIAAADISRQLRRPVKVALLFTAMALFMLGCIAKQGSDPWVVSLLLPVPWLLLGATLPVIALAAVSACILLYLRPSDTGSRSGIFPFTMWTAFALGLLPKILLAPRLYHYGFALAMPATLVLVACFTNFIPNALQRWFGGGDLFRRFAVVMMLADAVFFLKISNSYYGNKNLATGSGGDLLFSLPPQMDPRGAVIARVLPRIATMMRPDATFMVLPEGIMLNYLSRHANPTPYVNFMPPEIAIFGEENILASMKERSPDFILLTTKDAGEYGLKPFGTDVAYGEQIMEWVNSNYSIVEDITSEQPTEKPFEVKILKRRSL